MVCQIVSSVHLLRHCKTLRYMSIQKCFPLRDLWGRFEDKLISVRQKVKRYHVSLTYYNNTTRAIWGALHCKFSIVFLASWCLYVGFSDLVAKNNCWIVQWLNWLLDFLVFVLLIRSELRVVWRWKCFHISQFYFLWLRVSPATVCGDIWVVGPCQLSLLIHFAGCRVSVRPKHSHCKLLAFDSL